MEGMFLESNMRSESMTCRVKDITRKMGLGETKI
jgi:hypothetical protein